MIKEEFRFLFFIFEPKLTRKRVNGKRGIRPNVVFTSNTPPHSFLRSNFVKLFFSNFDLSLTIGTTLK